MSIRTLPSRRVTPQSSERAQPSTKDAVRGQALGIAELPHVMVEPVVRATLLEDLGRAGDLTTAAIVPADAVCETALVSRETGVLAGLGCARMAFQLMDASVEFTARLQDGAALKPGEVIATVRGPARAILSAERSALNLLGQLSGVASATALIAEAIAPWGTRVTCTRKTLPGLRALQKYAVRVGGGSNHRFGLDDAVLIKDNHVAVAGSIRNAVERARAAIGHLVKIEVEVDTLAQLDEALELDVEVVLLDNMDVATLHEAVRRARGRAITEASGRVTPETVVDVAATGVDLIAIGWLTHSARVLDIGLDALDSPVAGAHNGAMSNVAVPNVSRVADLVSGQV